MSPVMRASQSPLVHTRARHCSLVSLLPDRGGCRVRTAFSKATWVVSVI